MKDWDEIERRAKEHVSQRQERESLEQIKTEIGKQNWGKIRKEIQELEAEGLSKEIPIPGGKRHGVMEHTEIVQTLDEGITNFTEAKGELAAVLATVSYLRDAANALVTGIPGSSAAEEAAQILEALVARIDEMAGQIGEAEEKFTELQSYFGSPP